MARRSSFRANLSLMLLVAAELVVNCGVPPPRPLEEASAAAETNEVLEAESPATNPPMEAVTTKRVAAPLVIETNFAVAVPEAVAVPPTNVLKLPSTPKEWKALASKGDVAAQVELGKLLLTKHDYGSALEWFGKAADQGNPIAERNVAEMYLFGQGTQPDYEKAVVWFTHAAEQGDDAAQYSLGMRYFFGQGVQKDDSEAVWWWSLSADQGNSDAQASLARRFAAGEGVLPDRVEAYKWFDIADKNGHLNAGDARDELAITMSPTEIAKAKARSDAFVPTKLEMK